MKINRNLTTVNRSRYSNRDIDYLVIHYTGAFGSAHANTKYFKTQDRGSSAHYFVDKNDIWQVVKDEDVSWHCGGSGVGPFKNVCRNSNSIGIEMVPNKIDRSSSNSTHRDWYFDEETVDKTLKLVRLLMAKYHIPHNKVIRHNDVTGKRCPRPYMGNDINKYYKLSGNQMWSKFKQRVEEGDTMDGEMIFKKLNQYLSTLPTTESAKSSSSKGVKSGLFADGDGDGLVDNPKGLLTREQFAVVLDRAGLLD